MTNHRKLIDVLWHEPPVFFPIAALFHLFLLVLGCTQLSDTLAENWPTLAWYAAGFVFAAGCLLLRRWGAIGYILLTIAGLLLARVLHVPPFWRSAGTTLFPFDVVCSGLILFFYKRFR